MRLANFALNVALALFATVVSLAVVLGLGEFLSRVARERMG